MSEQIWSAFLLSALVFVALVAHEIVFTVFGIEEPVFLFLSYGCIFMLLGWIAVVAIGFVRTGEPTDFWRLGAIAVIGILGSLIPIDPTLIGFFPLAGLLALRSTSSPHYRRLLTLVLVVEGLFVVLIRTNIALAYEPTIWGDNFATGTAAAVAIILALIWIRSTAD